jgi:glutaredoxin-related protein
MVKVLIKGTMAKTEYSFTIVNIELLEDSNEVTLAMLDIINSSKVR